MKTQQMLPSMDDAYDAWIGKNRRSGLWHLVLSPWHLGTAACGIITVSNLRDFKQTWANAPGRMKCYHCHYKNDKFRHLIPPGFPPIIESRDDALIIADYWEENDQITYAEYLRKMS